MKIEIKKYINNILGNNALSGNFISVTSLPYYLLELYDVYTTSLLNNKYIFMVVKEGNQTAANICKHSEIITKHHDLTVIYVSKSMKSYQRNRLIEKKIPFVVPNNQMYLPMLGLDLREHFKQFNNSVKTTLSPLAQVLIVQYMNAMLKSPLTTKNLINTTSYSPMTVNRAFKQLTDYKLAKLVKVKREKQLTFIEDKATLWQKSLHYLKSPIKKTLFLNNLFDESQFYQAGEVALSELTMLISPMYSQCAIGQKQWLKIKDQYNEDVEGKIKLEIWYYDPGLISQTNFVDKYSLYLSLLHNDVEQEDERVQMALEELIKT